MCGWLTFYSGETINSTSAVAADPPATVTRKYNGVAELHADIPAAC